VWYVRFRRQFNLQDIKIRDKSGSAYIILTAKIYPRNKKTFKFLLLMWIKGDSNGSRCHCISIFKAEKILQDSKPLTNGYITYATLGLYIQAYSS
jgi:hypothetical protein